MSNYQTTETTEATTNLLDRAAVSADQALDSLAQQVNRLQTDASQLSQRGLKAVREGTQQLREKADRASELTQNYVKGDPVKALLIAAATGAALVALIGLMTRSRN